AGALLHALALQIGRERQRHLVEIAIADRLVHADEGLAVGKFRKALFQQLDERCVLGHIDIGGHAGRILLEPDALHGISPLVWFPFLGLGRLVSGSIEQCGSRWQAAAHNRRVVEKEGAGSGGPKSGLTAWRGGGLLIRRLGLAGALGFDRRLCSSLGLCRLRNGLITRGYRLFASFWGGSRLGILVSDGVRFGGRLRVGLGIGPGVLPGVLAGILSRGIRLFRRNARFLFARPHGLLLGVHSHGGN